MKNTTLFLATVLFLFLLPQTAQCDVPFDTAPGWRSNEDNFYFTGARMADIDADGYQDFISSAGNDIIKAKNYAWHNVDGELTASAWWTSSDNNYSGHCSTADIDDDGYVDLAIANYIDTGWGPARSQVYFNIEGSLENTPSWVTAGLFYSFSCAFGDADGDGDMDLAFACGEGYSGIEQPDRIFLNTGGALGTQPFWFSDLALASYDVYWVDVEMDGDLDVSFISSGGPVVIHLSDQGVIEETPSWESADTDNGNSLCWGDIDNNGFPDLVTANNYQLVGDGYFQAYMNMDGIPETTPSWQSATPGYGSAVTLADFDFDGDLDLATGRWWDEAAVYENENGILGSYPAWECSPSYNSVVEEFCLGDIDRDGIRFVDTERKAVDGSRKVFYLDNAPAIEIETVISDGNLLGLEDWCADPEAGWVSLGVAPSASLKIGYSYSVKPDLGISNWDRENFLFTNFSDFESAPLSVKLRGHDIPIQLPSSGGEVGFDGTIVSNVEYEQVVDAWLMVRLPNGSDYGPIINRRIRIESKSSLGSGAMSGDVPAVAPGGTYNLILYAGDYPGSPADSSMITFTKSASIMP